ncbi:MAG: hypothetical protein EBZ59_07565, partial [Planctomycetia bacterium]|nr:hypothetical protein [Planctomycetia bacterium]
MRSIWQVLSIGERRTKKGDTIDRALRACARSLFAVAMHPDAAALEKVEKLLRFVGLELAFVDPRAEKP